MPETTNSALRVERIKPDIALITMDFPGSSANILNDQMFEELDQTMETLAAQEDLKGVILFSAKPRIFVAGADLKRIAATADWSDAQIIKFCDRGRAVMARFSRCPFVSVAAIHGACVGGGLELTLWCDCRVATSARETKLGLPEVGLGLIPSWAGTTRLPRLTGFQTAADLITSGRLVSAEQAKQMKFVDEVVEQEKLLDEAVQIVNRVSTSQSFIRDRRAMMGPVEELGDLEKTILETGKKIVENQDVFLYAPTVVLEHMARTAPLPHKEGWKSESRAMAQVYGSPANRGLLNHFFLVDHNKKKPGLVDLSINPQKIDSVGIVGAGLMGASIAKSCLNKGISVVLYDAQDELAQSVAADLGGINTATIKAATTYQEMTDVPLVIEAVVETLDVKKLVIEQIESVVSENTIVASNTSSIPIEQLAAHSTRPQNLCGIHFCHPELMSLVEVVCGPSTNEQTIATAVGFVRQLRMMPIAINDGAGFVVNRLLAAMIDQAIRLFTSGVPIESIDLAMREFGFRGGPFEIIDVIGTDTCMYAGRTMWDAGLRCVTPSPILPKMVKSGRLGRKAGAGFYRYSDPRGERQWDDKIMDLIGSYQDNKSSPLESSTQNQTIVEQILSAIVLEATFVLDQEIVGHHRDVDLAIIHGFSFPRHHGGILFWADQVGIQKIRETLEQIGKQDNRMLPNATIQKMDAQELRFYN